jgi:hypothetical protein
MQNGAPGTALYGPFAVPGRRNLLAVALDATNQADQEAGGGTSPAFELDGVSGQPRWVNGFTFLADSCDAMDPMGIQCLGSPTDKDIVENPDLVIIDPFLTFGADVCSTMDMSRDREGRARRNLLATESWQIEREFFDGIASKTTTPDGRSPYMTDGATATAISATVFPATRALAELERELLACLHGQRGIIHARPDLVTLWQAGGALRLEGNTILTVLDTIIVPGSGYSGAGPDGTPAAADTSWAYGTGLVYLRQANIIDPDVTTPYARVDRGQNTTTWRIERPNAVYFAPCCVKAVHASLTT